ncbi:hypothetical protein EXIGLDRAFT_731118 [Exidia glandulosa HHB12029]|uniref:Uncharacterized protein n=1 Tax=Exidia glandulosa HHB12029 TaxID=1314781 RepID=A0A165C021_EXIGL|nr:hypothetical protein EXIGLDRAFT_731118 [Exidia glandulosa HHB12029]
MLRYAVQCDAQGGALGQRVVMFHSLALPPLSVLTRLMPLRFQHKPTRLLNDLGQRFSSLCVRAIAEGYTETEQKVRRATSNSYDQPSPLELDELVELSCDRCVLL